MNYDAETCITAGEMRAAGVNGIPAEIPDCAWVPRASLRFGPVSDIRHEGDMVMCSVGLEMSEPWRWFEADVVIQ